MFLVLVPITCVLTTQLGALILPVCALAVALVNGPHALILISIFVELDAEAFLAVITPITDILLTGLPLFALDSAIFLLILLLDPVDGAMCAILLCLSIVNLPEVHELTVWVLQGLRVIQHG